MTDSKKPFPAKTYESSVPCEYGHIGLRFSGSDACVTCYRNKKKGIVETKISEKRVQSPIPNQKVGKPMPDIPPKKKEHEPLGKPDNNLSVLLDDPYAVLTFVPNNVHPLTSGILKPDENGFINAVVNGSEHPNIELGRKYASYAILLPARNTLATWDGEITDDGLLRLFHRNQNNKGLSFLDIPFKMMIDDEDRPIWEIFLKKYSILSETLSSLDVLHQRDFFNRFFVPASHVQQHGWGGLFQCDAKADAVRWIRTTAVDTSIRYSDAFKCQAVDLKPLKPDYKAQALSLRISDDDALSLLTAIRYSAIWDEIEKNKDKVLAVDYKKITLGDLIKYRGIREDRLLQSLEKGNYSQLIRMTFPEVSKADIMGVASNLNILLNEYQLTQMYKQANQWLRDVRSYATDNVLLKQLETMDIIIPQVKKRKYQTAQQAPRGKIIDAKIIKMVEHGSQRAQAKQATPKWANFEKMETIYSRRVAGEQIDHIVPLNHPFVCGLHWEGNLEPLNSKANKEKGNKVWPDMPNYTGKDYAVLMALKRSMHIVDYDISAVFRRWKDGKLRSSEWDFILDNSKAFDIYLNERTVFNNEETHRRMWDALNRMKPTLQTASLDKIKDIMNVLHLDGPHMTWQDVNTFLLMIANRPDAWDILERAPLLEKFKQPYLDAKGYASFLNLQFRDVFFIKNAHFLKEKTKEENNDFKL